MVELLRGGPSRSWLVVWAQTSWMFWCWSLRVDWVSKEWEWVDIRQDYPTFSAASARVWCPSCFSTMLGHSQRTLSRIYSKPFRLSIHQSHERELPLLYTLPRNSVIAAHTGLEQRPWYPSLRHSLHCWPTLVHRKQFLYSAEICIAMFWNNKGYLLCLLHSYSLNTFKHTSSSKSSSSWLL